MLSSARPHPAPPIPATASAPRIATTGPASPLPTPPQRAKPSTPPESAPNLITAQGGSLPASSTAPTPGAWRPAGDAQSLKCVICGGVAVLTFFAMCVVTVPLFGSMTASGLAGLAGQEEPLGLFWIVV